MPDQKCAFCNRPANEVKTLIGEGSGPFICNRCVEASVKALGYDSKPQGGVKKDKPLLRPKGIKAFLDDYVIGQESTKVDIAVAVYNHYKRREAIRKGMDFGGVEIKKSNILMMGPSGSGKTECARAIVKMLDVPFYVCDATKMTQAGYVGDDVESMLQGLLGDSGGDLERAEWGIIFIDEVDKLARKSGRNASGYRDVTGEGVQQALLKILEGSRVTVPRGMTRLISSAGQDCDMVDTSNILFICAGSFAGIEEVVKKRVNKSARMGFGATARKDMDEGEVYSAVEEEDVLEFGLIPELMGRLPILTSTMPLTEDELVQILTVPKNALVKQFKALFAMDGIDLQFDEEALRAIGQEAKKRPTGARALRSIMENLLKPYAFEYPGDNEIKAIRISKEVVEGEAEATIVRETPEKAAQQA
jgi:ATP-dependent Clp protease ATP-binding subunit ClpX